MRKLVLFPLLTLALLWILPVKISIGTDQDPTGVFGNTELPEIATIDWGEFWALFNRVSAWDLEYNQGLGWSSIKGDLTVLRKYPTPWFCKMGLIFNASYHADYQLTFLVDRRVQNYSYVENRTRYILSYQNYTVFFSWEDLLAIPGLEFSHGVTDYLGKPCFWFRLRRDNVPQGTYLELDPSFGYETKGIETEWLTIEDKIKGSWFQISEDGSAQDMVVYLYATGDHKVKCSLYTYVSTTDVGTLIASTQEREIANGTDGWETFSFSSPPSLNASTNYWLLVWANSSGGDIFSYYDIEASKGMLRPTTYGAWPDPFDTEVPKDRKHSIYCIYSNVDPTIGAFSVSGDPIYSNEFFSINCTIHDGNGITELKNCSLELSQSIILGWNNATGIFSKLSDPYSYCFLNSSACIEDAINSTAFILSWNLFLYNTYPHGTSVDVVAANTVVYDVYGASGSNSKTRLFVFEPEEAGEPGVPTGGARRTPLEELGVPTPLPYEVAPPEAQYGSIGLIIILAGGTIYYVSKRGKSTQQLWRENTAPRSRTRSSTKPKARKVHSKRPGSRRVHSKKKSKRRTGKIHGRG